MELEDFLIEEFFNELYDHPTPMEFIEEFTGLEVFINQMKSAYDLMMESIKGTDWLNQRSEMNRFENFIQLQIDERYCGCSDDFKNKIINKLMNKFNE